MDFIVNCSLIFMPKKFLTSKLIKFISSVVICGVLILINPRNFFNPIREFFFIVAYPFQKTFYFLGQSAHDFSEILLSIGDYKKDNEKLIRENNELLAELASLKDQKRENEELRRQLELLPKDKYELESSLVIGQDQRGSGSWIIIDKGEADGLREGMPVIVYNGILVGKISEVYEKSSKALLLSDSSSSVNVYDIETSARGILTGKYGLGLMIGMVEQTEIIKTGDEVITSGLGGLMPRGLLIGEIEQISNTSDKLFQEAVVRPKIRYSDLNVVFVIKKSK